jgi:hypothetical protein
LGSKPARRSFPNSVDVVSVVKSLVRIVPEVDLILLLEKALEVKFNSTIFGQTYEIRKNVVLEEIKRRQQKL